jgi:uncharacterized membrane protein YkvA (DUF1232 family)
MFKRLTLLWVLLRGDARQLWFALRHPQAPNWLRWGTAGIALYLFSPIDFIPDMVPFFGIADDLVLVPLAIRFLLKRLPPEIAEATAKRSAGQVPPGSARNADPR